MAAYLFSKLSTLALVLLTQGVYTSAHGFVQDVVVGGQVFPGWNPFNDP